MRIVTYTTGTIVTLLALLLVAFFLHSSVLTRKSLQELKVSETDIEGHPDVIINGRLLGGMVAVRSAEQYRQGRSIILLVRAGITRPGLRDATFHYDIRVPNDVDEISFGNSESVVWRRKK